MIQGALDNLIAFVSPSWGVRRVIARHQFEKIKKRNSHDAAKKDRTTNAWRTSNLSADRTLQGDAGIIRARARDLVRNDAYAKRAVKAIVNNVVGRGIIPRPNTGNPTLDKAVQAHWNEWVLQRNCDIGERLNFYQIQRLLLSEIVTAGESLVQFLVRPSGNKPNPIRLELIEADRLIDEYDLSSIHTGGPNEIRRGVEVNADGKAVAYHLWGRHPNDLNFSTLSTERRTADQILHLYNCDRIGQTRGVSWFSTVLLWLRDMGVYLENELTASAIASCLTAIIKTIDGGDSWGGASDESGEDSSDSRGNTFERFEPGQVAHLLPNEEIEVVNPGRPNDAAAVWINLIIRSIAVGMDLSFEVLSRDYSQTNFSSNRASQLEDRRAFRPVQQMLIDDLCQPTYERVYEAAVMAGVKGFPNAVEFFANPRQFLKVNWQRPGWEWVDPRNEAASAQLEIQTNLRSHSEVIAASGRDPEEVFEQIAKDKEELKRLDLMMIPPPVEESEGDDSEDNSEDESEENAELETASKA